MLQEQNEIPFIATYRKDYWYSGEIGKEMQETIKTLTAKHLWQILELDDKWYQFQSKRKNVTKLFAPLVSPESVCYFTDNNVLIYF